jgi:hypothetical protein
MILYYYQPLKAPPGGNSKNNFEVFEAKIRVDAEFKNYGVHIVPIVRDTKERGFSRASPGVAESSRSSRYLRSPRSSSACRAGSFRRTCRARAKNLWAASPSMLRP